jgi:carbamoyl-phosphate synthase large subunit
MNLLITSAGRRNQLIECFRHDAALLGVTLRVLAADMNPRLSSACHIADAAFVVPRCSSADYIPALLEICRRQNVDMLVPTIDPELMALSQYTREFATAGTRVVVSPPAVIALAGNKFVTAELLRKIGILTPKTCWLADYEVACEEVGWPVIVKPNGGSASQGIVQPKNPAELSLLRRSPAMIVQERWNGREYTVNLFFDKDGRLRCAVPHERVEVRAGEVAKGLTERHKELCDIARKVAVVLQGACGPVCFQAMVDDVRGVAVFEINARFGGGYPLAHRAGARFSQWLLEEVSGLPATANDNWRAGVTMLRYDNAVFLDD